MVTPIFENNTIPIVLASNKKYVCYLTVMIRSIVLCSSPDRNYDIIVLANDIEDCNKNIIINDNLKSNVSIRFVNITGYTKCHNELLYTYGHFTVDVYSRLFISKIFGAYEKVLYLDCDMVVLSDVAELYDYNIGNSIFAATVDYGFIINNSLVEYAKNILKMKKPDKYKQSGVLIVNVSKMIEKQIFDRFISALNEVKKPKYPDQCIINATCEDDIFELPQCWNVTAHLLFDKRYAEDYRNKISEIKILHYSGAVKPDACERNDITAPFWNIARQTGVYIDLVEDFLINVSCKQTLSMLDNLRTYRFYSFLAIVTMGLIGPFQARKRYYREQFRAGRINWNS